MLTLKTRDTILAVDPAAYDSEMDTVYIYPELIVNPAATALVIIDPWASHPNDGWAARASANLISHLVPLLSACRSAGMRIVFAPTGRPIHPAVAPLPNETVIATPSSNTDDVALDQALVSWGVDTVLYAGYASNMCVLEKPASARHLSRIRVSVR